jgi:hypothetical protein
MIVTMMNGKRLVEIQVGQPKPLKRHSIFLHFHQHGPIVIGITHF